MTSENGEIDLFIDNQDEKGTEISDDFTENPDPEIFSVFPDGRREVIPLGWLHRVYLLENEQPGIDRLHFCPRGSSSWKSLETSTSEIEFRLAFDLYNQGTRGTLLPLWYTGNVYKPDDVTSGQRAARAYGVTIDLEPLEPFDPKYNAFREKAAKECERRIDALQESDEDIPDDLANAARRYGKKTTPPRDPQQPAMNNPNRAVTPSALDPQQSPQPGAGFAAAPGMVSTEVLEMRLAMQRLELENQFLRESRDRGKPAEGFDASAKMMETTVRILDSVAEKISPKNSFNLLEWFANDPMQGFTVIAGIQKLLAGGQVDENALAEIAEEYEPSTAEKIGDGVARILERFIPAAPPPGVVDGDARPVDSSPTSAPSNTPHEQAAAILADGIKNGRAPESVAADILSPGLESIRRIVATWPAPALADVIGDRAGKRPSDVSAFVRLVKDAANDSGESADV